MKTIDPLNTTTSGGASDDHGQAQGPTFQLPEGDRIDGKGRNEAADLIRGKLDALYAKEPNAAAEAEEVEHLNHRPSKHQKFMKELNESGKSLAEIQTAWHNYYVALPDDEKHQVWQEFYAAVPQKSHYAKAHPQPEHDISFQHPTKQHVGIIDDSPPPRQHRGLKKVSTRTMTDLRQELVGKVDSRSKVKLKAKHHLQSLAFGLGVGGFVMLVLLFGFFNERFIAPFITPSRNVSATPIIVDPNSVSVGPDSKVIIPKINVEIPVVYDIDTRAEADMQKGLERGVVHYHDTPEPGQKGNAVIFGHSANNILNPGKYKFAFVLLSRVDTGDTFYLQKDGKRYAYRVFEKKIVEPTNLSVLNPIDGKVATATLITCDPPGTSLKRLIVVGEQISPDPSGNAESKVNASPDDTPKTLSGNSPSLWSRIVDFFH